MKTRTLWLRGKIGKTVCGDCPIWIACPFESLENGIKRSPACLEAEQRTTSVVTLLKKLLSDVPCRIQDREIWDEVEELLRELTQK